MSRFKHNKKRNTTFLYEALVKEICDEVHQTKTTNFGNARWVRNYFERCKMEQAQRLSEVDYLNEENLKLLTVEDLQTAYEKYRGESLQQAGEKRKIGY